ncbi:DUF1476 domain-containing protein [Pararhodobacter sp.]|uniref:DUF1476 domain-containing protein n=1 Tax=Pararhodobacter sp. TaxID=2127056 RepID=UPI002AFFECF9|nr:DUF1476 domain-containing protein [Pararhodobacter sp.]
MSTFDERENAFENKFAHDAEMAFKAISRRNRAVGTWAAGLLGKTGDDVAAYELEVIKADFEEEGHEDVIRKLVKDLHGKADEATIRAKMAALLVEAQTKLMNEG